MVKVPYSSPMAWALYRDIHQHDRWWEWQPDQLRQWLWENYQARITGIPGQGDRYFEFKTGRQATAFMLKYG